MSEPAGRNWICSPARARASTARNSARPSDSPRHGGWPALPTARALFTAFARRDRCETPEPKLPAHETLDPLEILRVLVENDVRFIVIGGIAAALHGSTTLTADLDILYDRSGDNIERLAHALTALGAVRRDLPAGLPAPLDARTVRNGTNFLLTTREGDLDCIGETPSGRFTYAQVAPTAERIRIGADLDVEVVSLDELIRMKRATGRTKDRIELETLSALRDEREHREDR